MEGFIGNVQAFCYENGQEVFVNNSDNNIKDRALCLKTIDDIKFFVLDDYVVYLEDHRINGKSFNAFYKCRNMYYYFEIPQYIVEQVKKY